MQQNDDLARLDGLIAEIGGADIHMRTEGPSASLTEHLRAARRNLMASMPGEYQLSLQMAGESLAGIAEKSDRNRVKQVLLSLANSEHKPS
jgi:hypothetical protein